LIKPTTTKNQIAEAALETLRTQGFAAATSRAIARTGGFNQALIFYHYGSLENLLLAALDLTSRERLARYEAALEKAASLQELARAARRIYREDERSGHIRVVAQMVAGSVGDPELARRVLERMEPWIDFTEQALRRFLEGSPLTALLPVRALARGVVAYYLGVNLLTHLGADPGVAALLGRLEQLAPLLDATKG
jgi:AcrR family transcriptional regulator